MTAADILPILLIVLIIGSVCFYFYKQKKKGRKCIGCPYHSTCQLAGKGHSCYEKNKKKENKTSQ